MAASQEQRKELFVFQKGDGKFRNWAKALEDHNIEAVAVSGSPILSPLFVAAQLFRGKRVSTYVFRYLNDYRSLTKTLLRFGAEVLTVAIARIAGGRVLWILHNVNSESVCFHPRLGRMRRWIVGASSHAVLVTDPIILERARSVLPGHKRITWTCFGEPDVQPANEDTQRVEAAMRELRIRLKNCHPDKRVYIGICVSAPSAKCSHLLRACSFVDRYSFGSVVVGIVVVCDIRQLADEQFRRAAEQMQEHDHIVLIDEHLVVRERHLVGEIDFFYRAINDISVSYTIYVAAAVQKPILSEAGSFMADFVALYRLGGVAEAWSLTGENWLESTLTAWDPAAAAKFLEERSWDIAARQLVLAAGSRNRGAS